MVIRPEQRAKSVARAYANVYKKRGKLIPEPCKCGNPQTEMHHIDYSQPLAIEWLCRDCHLAAHQKIPVLAAPPQAARYYEGYEPPMKKKDRRNAHFRPEFWI